MNILIISLLNAKERRDFQQNQLSKLDLEFEFLDATSTNDINTETYKKHDHDWQRPLKKTEVACYYSHKSAWNKIIKTNQPALILEDDALLSKCLPDLLTCLFSRKNIDLINLENNRRKKNVSKFSETIVCNSKLLRLYQDRAGAAGYILWPSGATKLIQCERQKGIALADAHITECNNLITYQVEPSPIIQLECCDYYKVSNSINKSVAVSGVSSHNNPKGGIYFRLRRVYAQIKLGIYQLTLIIKSERRHIIIRRKDF
jgi:glycosyl transferase family 25